MSDKLNLDDFELKELNEENFKDSVIERKNVVTEFTIDLIENHQTDLQKLKKSCQLRFLYVGLRLITSNETTHT